MKHITYSAPAKVILSGEHAVVYGKPAIVASLDLRLKFTITSVVRSYNRRNDPNIQLLTDIVKGYLKKNKIKYIDNDFSVKIKSNIPIKKRLGSSAAFCVAGVASLLDFYTDREWDKETINNLSYLMEKHFHTNASGVDTSIASFGGLVYYRKEFEFLKTISVLDFKIPPNIDESLYLIDSGNPQESTGQMVEAVGKLYNKKPQFVDSILNDIEKTTKRMVISLIKKDVEFFVKCIIDNQIFLDMLGVVSEKARIILKKLEPYGIGKVTGGGGKKKGSGYIMFFATDKTGLEKFCKNNKINFYKFEQSYTGVKKENDS